MRAREQRHPLPGPRLGGQFRRVLLPRRHRGRSDKDRSAVRTLHFQGTRGEPPDIDVDFEHERREEVMQYVYQRYGRDRAAISPTVIHYRAAQRHPRRRQGAGADRGCHRGAGRTPSGASWGDGLPDDHVRQAGLDPFNPAIRHARSISPTELIGLSAPPVAACRRLRADPATGSTRPCRSAMPRWRTAPSSSGTRTTSTRSA